MRLEYTLTLDDWVEALKPVKPDGTPIRKTRRWRGALAWLVFVLVVIATFFLLRQTARPARFVPRTVQPVVEQNAAQDLWATLLPPALPALFILSIMFVTLFGVARRGRMTARNRKTLGLASKITGALMMAIILSAVLICMNDQFAITWHPSRGDQLFMGFLPIIVLCILFFAYSVLFSQRRARVSWEKSPSLHRPKTVEFDESGLVSRDDLVDYRCKWPHFDRVQERETLFILFTVDQSILLIPKRAFDALPEGLLELDRFRGLLKNSIADAQFLPVLHSAFPVLPVAQPPLAQLAQDTHDRA